MSRQYGIYKTLTGAGFEDAIAAVVKALGAEPNQPCTTSRAAPGRIA